MSKCQAIKGCKFNPIRGKNECIEDPSTTATAFEAYFSTESDFADEDEDEDEVAQPSESDRAHMPNLRGA
jgi:hypothetical protein